jgi:hypothetical protein
MDRFQRMRGKEGGYTEERIFPKLSALSTYIGDFGQSMRIPLGCCKKYEDTIVVFYKPAFFCILATPATRDSFERATIQIEHQNKLT